MYVITVAIQKGGTGKTATAAALAQAANLKGRKVLAIDLDPQGNLSYALAADATHPGSFDLLEGQDAETLPQPVLLGLDVIPASPNLAAVKSYRGSARRLQAALEPLQQQYDLCIIDTPATTGELQYNALQAADGLIIPLQADPYSLQSLYQIMETVQIFRHSNPDLKILGYLLTQYDSRSNISRQMKDTIESKAAELHIPFLGAVRNAVAIREAIALQESLFEYAPKSNPAQDYMQIYEQLEQEM